MTKIDIVSGFLGAGKTTLIKKLLKEALGGEQVVLIENEFGEIGIDGGFLQEAGIEIKEMNSGCICCSLVGDFAASLQEVLDRYQPDRVLIEPSGVGKLSDVVKAVENVTKRKEDIVLNSSAVVVDSLKCKTYLKNFGEFFANQIEYAGSIILSRTDKISAEKLEVCVAMIRELNPHAPIVTTPWDLLKGKALLDTIEGAGSLAAELLRQVMEERYGHDTDCDCGCREHGHDHHDHEHRHHDHEHNGNCECGCHDHEHHHDHDHHHGHDHNHHAEEIFTGWGKETPVKFTEAELNNILEELEDKDKYGFVLRAKGMLPAFEGDRFYYFDYVPGESGIRQGEPIYTGKICVIGSKLDKENLERLFNH